MWSACYSKKYVYMYIPTIASSSLGVYASASSVAFSCGFGGFGPPLPSRPPSPPSKVDAPRVASLVLNHALIVQRLIVVLTPPKLLSLQLSSCSSRLSCCCRSLRLHRPSRSYLWGGPLINSRVGVFSGGGVGVIGGIGI